MSKKKDLIKDDEFINVEPTTPEVENTEPETTTNGEEIEKPEEGNITPDIVNVAAGAPEINSEEKPENNEGEDEPTEGENEPEEEKSEDEVVEEKVMLKINKNFTDKYDNSIKYVKGKKYSFEVKRAEELLVDKRNLVSKVK